MNYYAVMGNPISHSISPIIHNKFAKQANINIKYEKIFVDIKSFKEAVDLFVSKNGKGFNITIPFKIDAFNLATKLTKNAKIACAVNTIKIDNDNLIGENTDGIGLVNDLTKNFGINLANKTLLILGAGGATRGILLPILEQKTNLVMIANRDKSKAIKLAKEFSDYGQTCGFGLEQIKNEPVDIIINATSASLQNKMPEIKNQAVANGAICYDLMYGAKTPFMLWAEKNNASKTIDGLGMLVEQAASSFEFWTGERPNTKIVIEELRRQATN